ncbi:fimbrial biogenesis chaperone [Pantoea agglomerans]
MLPIKSLLLFTLLFGMVHTASSSVIVGGTRVIYDSAKKETSLSVKNADKNTNYLIQSWIDNLQEDDKDTVPFIITPPLFKLSTDQENILRIVFTGGSLPQDKESAYWLNVKSIPSTTKTDQNTLQISVKTRIKLFYRPAGLTGDAAEAYKALTFSRAGQTLTVKNPTPYFVSFQSLKIGTQDIKEPGMVAPMSDLSWAVPAGASGKVSWKAINDYGSPSAEATAPL